MPEEVPPVSVPSRKGYRRAFERIPDLEEKVGEFERWLSAVEDWLHWIEDNIPENVHISRREAIEDIHMTSQGLRILEKFKMDVYPKGRDVTRTEYDLKKLLRAVVALPTIARLKGKRLVRQNHNIVTVFKEVIDDTLNGRIDIDDIHQPRVRRGKLGEAPVSTEEHS